PKPCPRRFCGPAAQTRAGRPPGGGLQRSTMEGGRLRGALLAAVLEPAAIGSTETGVAGREPGVAEPAALPGAGTAAEPAGDKPGLTESAAGRDLALSGVGPVAVVPRGRRFASGVVRVAVGQARGGRHGSLNRLRRRRLPAAVRPVGADGSQPGGQVL